MPRTGMPSSKISGEEIGAPCSYVLYGLPERIIPAGTHLADLCQRDIERMKD